MMKALVLCVVLEIVTASSYIGKGNDVFGNSNKTNGTDLTNFTTLNKSESYQKILQNSTGLPLNYKLNVLEKGNQNKIIKIVADSKSENNVPVSGKNNQENSKIIIKNLPMNGPVSNIAHNNITRNKDKASTNVNLIKSSSKINHSTNNSNGIDKKGTIIIRKIYTLNKDKNDEGMKPLSSQSDKSTFHNKGITPTNFVEKYNTIQGNHKTLYYILPNNHYHMDFKKVFLKKNSPDFIKKSPEQENIVINNYENTLGYDNMHKIGQGTGSLGKTKYNNERKYKTVKQNIKDTFTQNILVKNMNTKDQNKKKQNNVPLEFKVTDVSVSELPYYLQKFIGSPLNYKLNLLEKGNLYKQIKNVAKSKSENNAGLSVTNSQDKKGTTSNFIGKYNTIHGNHKTLYYVLPNNHYHIDSKKVILTKDSPDFVKKSPQQENIVINNYENTLGYDNMHKIGQGTGHLEKTKYNNEHQYKPVKQNIKDTIIQNILVKRTNTKNQNKKKILQSGKESVQNNLHNKKDREHEPLEVKNINDKGPRKISNLIVNRELILLDLLKPIEIEKTHEVTVKETKKITFGDRSKLDKKENFTNNNKNPNLSAKNLYKSFILTGYDSTTPIKILIGSDKETSEEDKIQNNNGKNNLRYVILNNLSSSNNKNNNSNNKKSTKGQFDLVHGKETILMSANDKAKKKICINCTQNTNIQIIKNLNGLLKKLQSTVHSTISNKNVKLGGKNIQNRNLYVNHNADKTSYRNKKYRHNTDLTGHRDIKKESIHLMNTRAGEEDNTKETSNVMTNKDKVISNILAPESVKSDKKLLPYWLPSDAQEVYEMLQQPSKGGAVSDSLNVEIPLKEEIDKIVQLKKELGNENLEGIITLKVNTVGIGKATNIIEKLIPSLYDVYLKNFITKILITLRQKFSHYESYQQKNDIKNLDIHEIRKANSVLDIFQSIRDVFNKQDDELLYSLLVSLLRFNKQSDEDFDEEVKVILESVRRNSIYGVLKYYLVPEPRIEAVRNYLKQQELYPQFVYYKVLEDILPNIRLIILNDLAITAGKHDDIHKNKDTMEKLVKILIILNRIMKDLGIPETTQRFIIEESVLDIVKNLAIAYIENYKETVYIHLKKQLQDALYNNINV